MNEAHVRVPAKSYRARKFWGLRNAPACRRQCLIVVLTTKMLQLGAVANASNPGASSEGGMAGYHCSPHRNDDVLIVWLWINHDDSGL
jgi:hypothetical protein